MFELTIRIKVEKSPEGVMGPTTVENFISNDGKEHGTISKDFDNPLAAYLFVGDYFYDMIEELTVRASMMEVLKTEQN